MAGEREIWMIQRAECTIEFHTMRRTCSLTWRSIRDYFPKATSWRGDTGTSPMWRWRLPRGPPAISGAQFCSRAPGSGLQPSAPAMDWWVLFLLCPQSLAVMAWRTHCRQIHTHIQHIWVEHLWYAWSRFPNRLERKCIQLKVNPSGWNGENNGIEGPGRSSTKNIRARSGGGGIRVESSTSGAALRVLVTGWLASPFGVRKTWTCTGCEAYSKDGEGLPWWSSG